MNPPSSVGHGLESNAPSFALDSSGVEPPRQVLTLADVKRLEVIAAVNHGLDAHAGNSDATANGQFPKLEEMKADAAQGGIGHGTATKREVEVCEIGTAERKDFGGGVREGTAEGLHRDQISHRMSPELNLGCKMHE